MVFLHHPIPEMLKIYIIRKDYICVHVAIKLDMELFEDSE